MTESERTEKTVQEYFESRDGWTVTKLDLGKERAADFRICHSTNCFLCEVKTVESVRANLPSTARQVYLARRKKQQAEIKRWIEQNPDRRLFLRPDEWEFTFGDEGKFLKRYSERQRYTQHWFSRFAETMKDHLSNSLIKDLPYSVRLDSDDLYVPNGTEQSTFFKWLAEEMQAINNGNPSRHWFVQKLYHSEASLYSAFYQIHAPAHQHDVKAEYQLTVEGPRKSGKLEIDVFSYGGLNLDAITSNIKSGNSQLEKSAAREKDPQMARIIVLAFASRIRSEEWQELTCHIAWLLKSHPKLSGIAVLERIPDGVPPPPELGIYAWMEFHVTTPMIPRFLVFHNSWRKVVKPLPVKVFSDEWSVQQCPIKQCIVAV